jgi:hypothetical protein
MEELNKTFKTLSSTLSHPQAIYTSRLLDFKNLPEPQNSKKINEQFWSKSLRTSFVKTDKITDYSNTLQFDFTNPSLESNSD